MDCRGFSQNFSRMRIDRTHQKAALNEENYTRSLPQGFSVQDCKPNKTPVDVKWKLEKAKDDQELFVLTFFAHFLLSIFKTIRIKADLTKFSLKSKALSTLNGKSTAAYWNAHWNASNPALLKQSKIFDTKSH